MKRPVNNKLGNLRRHGREPFHGVCEISWRDSSGNNKWVKAKGVNVSESGLLMEVPVPLQRGTTVSLRCPAERIHGIVSIRSCTSHSGQYRVGVEFLGGVDWWSRLAPTRKPEANAIPAPAPKPAPTSSRLRGPLLE